MATVDVLNWDRKKVGSVDLPSEVFEVVVKKHLLHTVVKWQLASRHQGTHMTKTKGLVSGGGKKPFKQKGTGGARQGSIRSILMPGGGTAFGPQPRSYAFALPKKMRKQGLTMALSHLQAEGRLFILENLKANGKTKDLAAKLKKFGLTKGLLVDSSVDQMTKRSSTNLSTFKYFGVEGLNVFDLLKYNAVLVSKDSISKVVERCQVGK